MRLQDYRFYYEVTILTNASSLRIKLCFDFHKDLLGYFNEQMETLLLPYKPNRTIVALFGEKLTFRRISSELVACSERDGCHLSLDLPYQLVADMCNEIKDRYQTWQGQKRAAL